MNRPSVYVETSIPSFYFELRSSHQSQARREWTRRWWATAFSRYQLFTSGVTLEELGRGDYPTKQDCLRLIATVPLLPVPKEAAEVIAAYVRHKLMPADPSGDALHLAVASLHHCEFLLTWNCRHLANSNKFGHIRRINTMLGLFTPTLTTPLELLGEAP